jgi:hypothetical protein
MVRNINLQDEITALNFLDKSLDHFSDAFLCVRENPSCKDQILSITRVQKILENISLQYVYRGINYKDVEVLNLLWNFINEDTPWTSELTCASALIEAQFDLLDDSGNKMRLSKKIPNVDIEEVLDKSQRTLEDLLKNDYEQITESQQSIIVNYLLSMWYYNALKGLTAESKKWYDEFDRLWNLSYCKSNSSYYHTFTSKLLHLAVEININAFKQNANNILFDAVRHIMKIRSIPSQLVNVYQRTFRRLVITTINYSINRMTDLDHYSKLMISCKANSIASGHFFRAAEYISMSITRHLNMEKLEFAMVIFNHHP